MRRALTLCIVLVAAICNFAVGGLIVQPSEGTTIAPGVTADFDLIIRNGTDSATWSGIVAAGPLRFEDPIPLSLGQTAPTFVPAAQRGITADADWNFLSQIILGEWIFGRSTALELAPGDETKLGTMSISIPADFMGSFQLELSDTIPFLSLTNSDGDDVTDGWSGDLNPPIPPPTGPPGPGAPTGFLTIVQVTAIPEPGPAVMLGFLGTMICGLRVWRRR